MSKPWLDDPEFMTAYKDMLEFEGGFLLHNIDGDSGGWTFGGISRNKNPDWDGWELVDQGLTDEAKALVPGFYYYHYWLKNNLHKIKCGPVAQSVFDFGVNTGTGNGAREAQQVVGAKVDGKIGSKTLRKINAFCPHRFLAEYSLEKALDYHNFVRARRTNHKFYFGWMARTLKGYRRRKNRLK